MIDLSKPGRLFHFSEKGDIRRFEPRPSVYTDDPVVWAIHEPYEYQYLFPRDCPRVTYCANPDSDPAAVDRHLVDGSDKIVVAIEAAWLDRMREARLYRYHMPPETFESNDHYEGAAQPRSFISPETIEPTAIDVMNDLLGELTNRGVEVRIIPSLWTLRDRILESTLPFSFIRMRNAASREERA